MTLKQYVGSSVNIHSRWKAHVLALNKGAHHSKYLQRAWDKYGVDQFEFIVCEIVHDRKNLIDREQYWIDTAGEYNVSRKADRPSVAMTDATRAKISATLKGRPSPMTGRKHTAEASHLMSSQRRGVLRSFDYGERISKGKIGSPLSEAHKESLRKPKSEAVKLKFRFAAVLRRLEPGYIPPKGCL